MSTKKTSKECENPSEVEAVEPPVFRGEKKSLGFSLEVKSTTKKYRFLA